MMVEHLMLNSLRINQLVVLSKMHLYYSTGTRRVKTTYLSQYGTWLHDHKRKCTANPETDLEVWTHLITNS